MVIGLKINVNVKLKVCYVTRNIMFKYTSHKQKAEKLRNQSILQ